MAKILADCETSVSVNPSEVSPQQTSGDTEAEVVVSLTNPAPSEGCEVKLSVEPIEDSGGHSHDSGRQEEGNKGTVTPNSITFSAGETEKATYKSSKIAGVEKIIAEIGITTKSEAIINVKVPGLISMPESGIGAWRLTGSYGQPEVTSKHVENHFGTPSTVGRIAFMATDYYEETGIAIGINDMSLIWGGLFDIYNNWSTPHSWHRTGKSVDVDHLGVNEDTLDKFAKEWGCKRYEVDLIHYECP